MSEAVALIAEFTVPSGHQVSLRRGKGRDMINAMRKTKEPNELTLALAAELMLLDGLPLVYEDILDMDLADVVRIQEEMNKAFLSSPTPKE